MAVPTGPIGPASHSYLLFGRFFRSHSSGERRSSLPESVQTVGGEAVRCATCSRHAMQPNDSEALFTAVCAPDRGGRARGWASGHVAA